MRTSAHSYSTVLRPALLLISPINNPVQLFRRNFHIESVTQITIFRPSIHRSLLCKIIENPSIKVAANLAEFLGICITSASKVRKNGFRKLTSSQFRWGDFETRNPDSSVDAIQL